MFFIIGRRCIDYGLLLQIENWHSSNGYAHLMRFTVFLKQRVLIQGSVRRSLKGVSPPVPFPDVAYRRLYDYALAYIDFKDASKSTNKHRLDLGFLYGPFYFEIVIYRNRERIVDQISWTCAALGRPLPYKECECEALLPPIQGNPFELDEVRFLLFKPFHTNNSSIGPDEGVGL